MIITLLLCGLMAASTNTALEGSNSLEEAAHHWKIIETKDLCRADKVLASLINLEHAHYVGGYQRMSAEISTTLDTLLVTHCTKMYLLYLVNGDIKHTKEVLENMQVYARTIVNAIPVVEQSKLQQSLISILNAHIINKAPPFSCLTELAELLKKPDTDPITQLLTSFHSLGAGIPSLEAPLELLLSLNWSDVFRDFVKSGYAPRLNTCWSYCIEDVQAVSALICADSLKKLDSVKKFILQLDLGFDLTPTLFYKTCMLTSQNSSNLAPKGAHTHGKQ